MKNSYFIKKNYIVKSLNRFSMASLQTNRVLLSFIFYSLLGWIIETCFILLVAHKFIPRGWILYGLPLIPLYGVGCLILTKLLSRQKKHPFTIFAASVAITTTIEYLIGLILIKIFNHTLWSYSDLPFSVLGIISLPVSFSWGLMSLLMIYWIDPNLKRMLNRIPAISAALVSWSIMIYSAICAGMFTYHFFH